MLSWWAGHTSDTPLDKDWDINQGSGRKQSRYLLVDGKKLVISVIHQQEKWSGVEKMILFCTYCFNILFGRDVKPFFFSLAYPPPTYETTVETGDGEDHYKRFE